MIRVLSFSEVSRALDCMAQWDFSYGDQLAGSSLKPKRTAPILSGGKAWGAAVAAYHSNLTDPKPGEIAVAAMDIALEEDAERQREFGVHQQEEHDELRTKLLAMLLHYVETVEPFPLDSQVERELLVPIPSRTGGTSSKYRLQAFLDGTRQAEGRPWLVEFKLRGRLLSVEQISLSRQIRWYAWAYWQTTGEKPAGVEVIERLNEAPKPPRMVQGRKRGDDRVPSHAKDQLCTVESYQAVCGEHEVEPNEDTVIALGQRKWQQRVPIIFREGELEDAGRELVTAAKVIHALDSGEFFPLRNVKSSNCNGCPFREICPTPDNDLVDALYERRLPKRDRELEGSHP